MKDKGYVDLSDASVQLGREKKIIPHTGQYLHDFVPICFVWKTPMVMQHQDKNEEIIFLRFSALLGWWWNAGCQWMNKGIHLSSRTF